jgi:anti-sigma-K factor RskA
VTVQEYIQSGAIENYIFGMADEAEARELEQMRALHPEVNEAFVQFESSLEQQSLQSAITPPDAVKANIMQAVGIGNNTPAKVISLPATRKPQWMQYAAAAGIAIMLGSVAMNVMLMGRVKKMNTEIASFKNNNTPPESQYAFIKDPAITPVAMYGVAEHSVCRCSLYWDKQGKKAYMLIHHLVNQPEDKDYQLWALVNGQPVSVGIFKPGDKSKPLILDNIPDNASGFAVTLEKKGGNPTPTLEQMFLKGQITT